MSSSLDEHDPRRWRFLILTTLRSHSRLVDDDDGVHAEEEEEEDDVEQPKVELDPKGMEQSNAEVSKQLDMDVIDDRSLPAQRHGFHPHVPQRPSPPLAHTHRSRRHTEHHRPPWRPWRLHTHLLRRHTEHQPDLPMPPQAHGERPHVPHRPSSNPKPRRRPTHTHVSWRHTEHQRSRPHPHPRNPPPNPPQPKPPPPPHQRQQPPPMPKPQRQPPAQPQCARMTGAPAETIAPPPKAPKAGATAPKAGATAPKAPPKAGATAPKAPPNVGTALTNAMYGISLIRSASAVARTRPRCFRALEGGHKGGEGETMDHQSGTNGELDRAIVVQIKALPRWIGRWSHLSQRGRFFRSPRAP